MFFCTLTFTPVANLESTLKHTFDVPNEVECRLWKGSTALLNSKQTLMDAGLIGEEVSNDAQHIIVLLHILLTNLL